MSNSISFKDWLNTKAPNLSWAGDLVPEEHTLNTNKKTHEFVINFSKSISVNVLASPWTSRHLNAGNKDSAKAEVIFKNNINGKIDPKKNIICLNTNYPEICFTKNKFLDSQLLKVKEKKFYLRSIQLDKKNPNQCLVTVNKKGNLLSITKAIELKNRDHIILDFSNTTNNQVNTVKKDGNNANYMDITNPRKMTYDYLGKHLYTEKLDTTFCKDKFETWHTIDFDDRYGPHIFRKFFEDLRYQAIAKKPELLKYENNEGLGEITANFLNEDELKWLIKHYGLRILFYYTRDENQKVIINLSCQNLACEISFQQIRKNPSLLEDALKILHAHAEKATSKQQEVSKDDIEGVYRLLVEALIYQHPQLLTLMNSSPSLTLLCQDKEFLASLINLHGPYILCYINNEYSLQFANKYKAAFQCSYKKNEHSLKSYFSAGALVALFILNKRNQHPFNLPKPVIKQIIDLLMPHTNPYSPFHRILNDCTDQMEIFVECNDNVERTLIVYPETKIEEVAFLLHKNFNLHKFQNLYFGPTSLQRGCLSENEVKKNCTLWERLPLKKAWRLNLDN